MARRELTYYDAERRNRRSKSRGHGSGRSSGGRNRRREDRRRFSVPDWIMVTVSVIVALGVVLSWAARWINPASYGFMSAAGLVLPLLYIANFLCLLYWTIRWRKGIFISLPIFLAGLFGITLFFRPELTRNHGEGERDRSLVSIVTYNVRGMMRLSESLPGEHRSSMREVIAVVDSLRPDILCMQDFRSTRQYPRDRFDEALPAYHYKEVRLNIFEGEGQSEFGWGNAIYSKYPIVASGHIDFGGSNNSVLWADIAAGRDTVRVFNAHLQTTSIKAVDERYIVDGDFVGDSTRRTQIRHMAAKLTDNYILRAGQADILADSIASSPHPVIVCGDFNDTPVSYAYRKISRRLRDGFREAGRGYGYTYRGFFDMLRIDYILHSRQMECVEYASPSFENSDHNPVAVKMRIRPNN